METRRRSRQGHRSQTQKRKTRRQGVLWPKKYYRGLSPKKKAEREKEIKKYGKMHWKDPKAYEGFKTNEDVISKPSSYTAQWDAKFPGKKSFKEREEATGVDAELLKECFNRGMAAWRTGHRPGATQQQWGWARVSSLLCKGKTAHTTDYDLMRKAIARSDKAKEWYSKDEPCSV
jgi:hypothetical protein